MLFDEFYEQLRKQSFFHRKIYALHLLVTSESKHMTIGKLTAVLLVKLL